MTALEINDVSHAYRKPALREVSFSLAPGDFVLLLGLNGAGKTTLFSLIAGLLDLQRGAIRVLGHALPGERSAALSGCGFVFQQPALDLDLTVAQSLRYQPRCTACRVTTHVCGPGRSSSVSASGHA